MSSLGFSIWLPDGWQVTEEREDEEDVAREAAERFERWRSRWWDSLNPVDRDLMAWGSDVGTSKLGSLLDGHAPIGFEATELPGGRIGSLAVYSDAELTRAVRALYLIAELSREEQDAARAQRLGRTSAYFQAEGRDLAGSPELEVVRYAFAEPLDALAFYQAAKPSQTDTIQGNRPNRLYSIDGMDAVRFYCQFAADPSRKALFYFASALHEGWSIDCWADARVFQKVKATLIEVAESFRRS